jgi:hypothetical protein
VTLTVHPPIATAGLTRQDARAITDRVREMVTRTA